MDARIVIVVLLGAQLALGEGVQSRLSREVKAGRPLVAHFVVALADNVNQGIVPVPAKLGNGRDPRGNLYWGAAYGLRTFFARNGWTRLDVAPAREAAILERVAFHTVLLRDGVPLDAVVVADAVAGDQMARAMELLLEHAAGRGRETVTVSWEGKEHAIEIGGAAALTGFVGHNGLFDLPMPKTDDARIADGRAAIVLACVSTRFEAKLRSLGATPLLLTTGLMAPEAYVLDGAIRAHFEGLDVHARAAAAYAKFQKCGMRGAERLFRVERDSRRPF